MLQAVDMDHDLTWNTGEESSSIAVTESGQYSASIGSFNSNETLGGLMFDGLDDVAEIPLAYNEIGAFSLSFWIRTTSDEYSRIINKDCNNCSDGEWKVDMEPDGRLVMEVEPGGGQAILSFHSTRSISDGALHHVMCTRSLDSGEGRIFIDGELDGTGMTTQDGVIVTNDWPLVMGNILTSTGAEFEGELYDVALWSIEVGQEQVLDVMSCSRLMPSMDLLATGLLQPLKTEPFSMSSVQQWEQ